MASASSGFNAAQARLEEIANRLKNPEPAMNVAAEDLRTFVDDRFETATDPDGKPWEPLAESTIRSRRQGPKRSKAEVARRPKRNAPGTVQPLVDTGRLRQSIATRVEGNTVFVGTSTEYGAYHQTGTPRMPARRFLPFVRVNERDWERDTAGPAGELWKSLEEMLQHYILTGEIK